MILRLTSPRLVRVSNVLLATIALCLALPAAAYAARVSIVVDPGHGGHDSGAVDGGLAEKDSNLQIARAVASDARRQGWSVTMTRDSDHFVPLVRRPAGANATKASAFISIHSNSTGESAEGNMTIYRSREGKKLGDAIMSELAPMTPYDDIGNRKDVRGLAVLRVSKRPAVIVENLSVTAPEERAKLKDPEQQKMIARAIVRGIAKYEGVKYKALPASSAPAPAPSAPTSLTPTPSAPTSLAPTPSAPTSLTPTPSAPTSLTPTPSAPTSLTPSRPFDASTSREVQLPATPAAAVERDLENVFEFIVTRPEFSREYVRVVRETWLWDADGMRVTAPAAEESTTTGPAL